MITVALFSGRVCLVMGRTLRFECLNWRRRWRPWRRSIKICTSSPLSSWPNPTRRASSCRSPPSEQSDPYKNGREKCIKMDWKIPTVFSALFSWPRAGLFFHILIKISARTGGIFVVCLCGDIYSTFCITVGINLNYLVFFIKHYFDLCTSLKECWQKIHPCDLWISLDPLYCHSNQHVRRRSLKNK